MEERIYALLKGAETDPESATQRRDLGRIKSVA